MALSRQQKIQLLTGAALTPQASTAIIRLIDDMASTRAAPSPGEVAVLFKIIGGDLASAEDQQFTKEWPFQTASVSSALVMNTSPAPTLCVGGVYRETGKVGAVVGSNQNWAGATTPERVLTLPISATQVLITDAPYLSMTTPSTTPSTVDIYIVGTIIS
jgi:hypothetical protein